MRRCSKACTNRDALEGMRSGDGVSCVEGQWTEPSSGRAWYYWVMQPPHPRALVVIVHGYGEHSGRYRAFARRLAEQGLCVAATDLWGHGRSGGRRGDIENVAGCVKQINLLTAQVFSPQSGHSRYVLFGHSFGALVAITAALKEPAHLRRLVIQSPLLEVAFPIPRWKTAAATVLARCWPTFSVSMGLDATMLSHDPAVVQAYRTDPLVHSAMSVRSYDSLLRAQDDVFVRAGALHIPVLLLCGSADRVVSVEAAQRWFGLLRCEKRCVVFPDAYHELHHETVRDDVLRLIGDWALQGGAGT